MVGIEDGVGKESLDRRPAFDGGPECPRRPIGGRTGVIGGEASIDGDGAGPSAGGQGLEQGAVLVLRSEDEYREKKIVELLGAPDVGRRFGPDPDDGVGIELGQGLGLER